jgi:hypothetical protein
MKAIVFFLILSMIYFSSLSCNTTDPGRDDNTGGADTTSQNFTFETYEFGDGGSSSYFNDVWVFDEKNIWAVGYISPASATVDGVRISNPNIIKWDGATWKLQPYSGTSSGIYGIWAYDTSLIYFAWGNVLKYENGVYRNIVVQGNWAQGQSIEKIWGSSKENIWGVGPWGTVVHYDGTGWKKIDFDTQWYFYNITGNKETGIAYATARNEKSTTVIVMLSEGNAEIIYQSTTGDITSHGSRTIEYMDSSQVYLADNRIWSFNTQTKDIINRYKLTTGIGIYSIAKHNKNDVYYFGTMVGGTGKLVHYNGKKYKEMDMPYGSYNYGGSSGNKNIAAYGGFIKNKAVITLIRRIK